MLKSLSAYLALLVAWLLFLASSLLVVRWVYPPQKRPTQPAVKIDLTTKVDRNDTVSRMLPPLVGSDRLWR